MSKFAFNNPGANGALASTELSTGRRLLLKSLTAALTLAPGFTFAASTTASPRRLILIELAGGNDGLNTVVPYSEKRYYSARPVLALKKDSLVTLDERLALHPELAPLFPAWQDEEMQIALGVGYPDPNRSHFRSSDIWHTASGSERVLKRGWLTDAFSPAERESFSTDGIAFGSDYGPFVGSAHSLVLDNPATFVKQAKLMRPAPIQVGNQALTHVVGVRLQIAKALKELAPVIDARSGKKIKGSKLHKQLVVISELMASGAKVPIYKATLKGFDTHFHQPNRHKNLMHDLGTSLAGLRDRLKATNKWNDTLVMTYSEFGRRPAENGSRGTDHGTAAPIILMGGGIRGGFSGQQPVFPKQADEDLAFHLDYRSVYRAVVEQWLRVRDVPQTLKNFNPIDLV